MTRWQVGAAMCHADVCMLRGNVLGCGGCEQRAGKARVCAHHPCLPCRLPPPFCHPAQVTARTP